VDGRHSPPLITHNLDNACAAALFKEIRCNKEHGSWRRLGSAFLPVPSTWADLTPPAVGLMQCEPLKLFVPSHWGRSNSFAGEFTSGGKAPQTESSGPPPGAKHYGPRLSRVQEAVTVYPLMDCRSLRSPPTIPIISGQGSIGPSESLAIRMDSASKRSRHPTPGPYYPRGELGPTPDSERGRSTRAFFGKFTSERAHARVAWYVASTKCALRRRRPSGDSWHP
jgi:hypothetical protein